MSLAFDETAAALRVRIDAHERYATLQLEDVLGPRLAALSVRRVIDIGCGSGNFTALLADAASSFYLGMDKNAELLREAVNASAHAGRRHAAFVRADMDRALPFAADVFDLAVLVYSAYYTDRADRLIGDVGRVLTPSGRVFLIGPAAGNAEELDTIGEHVFGVAAAPAKNLRARRLQSEFLPALRSNGWRQVSEETFDCSLVFPDSASYSRYYCATPQYIELAAERGTPPDGAVEAAIGRLPARRVTKKVVLLSASAPCS